MIQGFLLGLSVNAGCLAVCSPVLLPFLIAEKKRALFPLMQFMAGRLIAYLFFAAAVGYAGIYFEGRINPKLFAITSIILALWLIASTFGKTNPHNIFCQHTARYVSGNHFPFFAGIALGLNICPPFLLGLNKTLEMGNILHAVVFFMGFYAGSSVWLLFLFLTDILSRRQSIRLLGQVLSLIVGIWFLYSGMTVLVE